MVYRFHLIVEKDASKLSLLEGDEAKALREWSESRDMGSRLFQAIDEILKEKKIEPKMVDNFSVDVRIPETYTSGRIAETVARTFGFAVKNLREGE